MSRVRRALILIVSLAIAGGPPTSDKRARGKDAKASRVQWPRTDRHGDPLPAGAVARLGTVRWRHVDDRGISWVRFSADGSTLLSLGSEGLVRLWETASGRERWHFGLARADGDHVIVSPDARVLASWTGNVIRLWDPATGKLLRELNIEGQAVSRVQLALDGKTLAAVVRGDEENSWIELWKVGTGQKVRVIVPGMQKGKQKAFRFLGLYFAAGDKILAAPGRYSAEETVYRFWDVATGTELPGLTEYPHDGLPPLSPNGKMLAALAKGPRNSTVVHLLDAATGKELRRLRPPLTREVVGTRFSPDSRTLAVVDDFGQLRLWDVSSGKVLPGPTRENNSVSSVVFAPDSQTVAVEESETVRLFQVATGKQLHELRTASPDDDFPRKPASPFTFPIVRNPSVTFSSVAFSPDGKLVAAAAHYNLIRRWKVTTGEELAPGPAGHEQRVCALAVAPDGRTAGSVSADGTLRLWDLHKSRTTHVLRLPWGKDFDGQRPRYSGDFCVAFSPDGKTVAAASPVNMVRLWEVATGKKRVQFQVVDGGVNALVFAPEGKWLISGGRNGVVCWDARNGKRLQQIAAPAEPDPGPIYTDIRDTPGLAISPDGRLLATTISRHVSSEQGAPVGQELRLWELATCRLRRRYPEPDHMAWWFDGTSSKAEANRAEARYLSMVAFAPDGKAVVWNQSDAIELWDLSRRRPLRHLGDASGVCGIAWRPGGHVVAIAHRSGRIRLVDPADGTIRGSITAPQGEITCIAFSPDGRTLLTGGKDTTVLVWDITRILAGKPSPPQPLSNDELTVLWDRLASSEGTLAGDAMARLESVAGRAVPFLRTRLRPAARVNPEQLGKLLADLGNRRYAVRKQAEAELAGLGERAEPFLRKRLKEGPPLEVRRRLEQILEKLTGFITVPERIRELRAIEVLEHIGTPEARKVLRDLAGGEPAARLTQEARAALGRLDRWPTSDR